MSATCANSAQGGGGAADRSCVVLAELRTVSFGLTRRAVAALAVAAGVLAVGSVVAADRAHATPLPTCSSAGIGVTALHGPVFYVDPTNSPAMTSAYAGYQLTNSTGAPLPDTWVQLSGFTGGSVGLGAGQPSAEQLATFPSGTSKSLFWYLTASAQTSTAQNHAVTVYSHQPGLSNSTALCTTAGGFTAVSGTIGANANKISSVTLSGTPPTLGASFSITVQGTTGTIGEGPTVGSGPAATPVDPNSLWTSPSSISGWPAGAFRLVGTKVSISPDGTASPQVYTDTLHLTNLGTVSRDYTAVYTFQATGFTATASTLLPVEQIGSGSQMKHTGSYPGTIPPIEPASNDLALTATAAPARLPIEGGTSTYTATIAGTTGASLDALVVSVPSGATVVPGSGTFDGTTLPDPVGDGNGHLVFQGPFTLTAGVDTLGFRLSHAAGSGPRRTSVVGMVGATIIDTTPNDLTDNAPATATVVLNTPPTAADDTTTVAASSGADTISVLSNDTDADNDSLAVTEAGQPTHGTTTYSASAVAYTPTPGYTGPDSFTYSISDGHGGTATGTVNVTVAAGLLTQTIDFPALADVSVLAHPVAQATSDSGLPVGYSSTTASVCSVDPISGAITLLATGTCTVQADQSGDSTHAATTPVQRSFTVVPAAQTITFPPPADVALASATTSVDAGADSALTVSYSATTPGVCTVNPTSGVVALLSTGTCTIVAAQPGNGRYAPAEDVTASFAVVTTPQVISFPQPGDVNLADGSATVAATSDSGLDVTFTSATGDVCTVTSAGALTLLSDGTCTIDADQPGDDAYDPATQVERSFLVVATTPSSQSLTTDPIADTPLLAGSLIAHASSDSGLPVSYSSATPSTCSVDASSGTVDLLDVGACTIDAAQAGDATYAPAAAAGRSFEITTTDQRIDFPAPPDVALLDGSATAAATADSSLPVSFDSGTPSTCTVDSSGGITLVATGSCSVTASQSGSAAYTPATDVTRTFHVVRIAQTITFPPPPDGRAGDAVGVAASSDAALPITYTASPSSVCAVEPGGTGLTLIGTGTCAVTAHQAGDTFYLPAEQTSSFTVTAALRTQTITFPPLPAAAVTSTSVVAGAGADSGLDVAYTSLTPGICGVTQNGHVSLLSAGVCTLQARQPGNGVYAAAPPATSSFAIKLASQTITLTGPRTVRFDATDVAVVGTATSGLPVTYAVGTPTVCSVGAGGALTLLAVGTCTVTGSQTGSTTYAPVVAAPHRVVVTALSQAITLSAPEQEDVSLRAVRISAASDAGLPVYLTAGPAQVCTLAGSTLTLVSSGRCSIDASAAGDATHDAATPVHSVVRVTAGTEDKAYTLPPAAASRSSSPQAITVSVLRGTQGQTLLAVSQPPRGRVTVDGDRIRISLPDGYKGTETFTYTTKDAAGQLHTATVTIDVPDSPPTVHPAVTATVAGSARHIVVPVIDANHDRLTVTVGRHPGMRVTVLGHRLSIVPDRATSGLVTIPVTVDDGDGGVAHSTVRVLVSPRPTRSAGRHLVPLGTKVSWSRVPTMGARFAVTAGGRLLCVTRALSCTVPQFIGPGVIVRVTVYGLDGTRSSLTPATPHTGARQLLGTVYFGTDSSTLSRAQLGVARMLARRAVADGFRRVSVVGYTDSRGSAGYNLALSRRRTSTVVSLLHRRGVRSAQAWRGEAAPAATNATGRGMALNRRVEIWVG